MNTQLYNALVLKCENKFTVSIWKYYGERITNHLKRLCTEFPFLTVGTEIEVVIDGENIKCAVENIIINVNEVLVDTGFGNVWYYEVKEVKK